MKGIELERSTVIIIILVIAVIAICIIIGVVYILNYLLPQYTDRLHVSELCHEWTAKGCSEESAINDPALTLNIQGNPCGGNSCTLAQLCNKYADGNYYGNAFHTPENPGKDELGTYRKCKQLCIGCP